MNVEYLYIICQVYVFVYSKGSVYFMLNHFKAA